MMTPDTEKALLEWVRTLAENASEYATDARLVTGARAYLATLWAKRDYQCPTCGCGTGNCTHAKPEPKRGVEPLIEDVIKSRALILADRLVLEHALRLYREERERVERVARTLRQNGPVPDDAAMRLADELERRDAD